MNHRIFKRVGRHQAKEHKNGPSSLWFIGNRPIERCLEGGSSWEEFLRRYNHLSGRAIVRAMVANDCGGPSGQD